MAIKNQRFKERVASCAQRLNNRDLVGNEKQKLRISSKYINHYILINTEQNSIQLNSDTNENKIFLLYSKEVMHPMKIILSLFPINSTRPYSNANKTKNVLIY